MKIYLACFDISDDRVRYRVGKLLGGFGTRVQKSVYILAIKTPSQLKKIQEEILVELEKGDDCRFYFLCKNCQSKAFNANGTPLKYIPSSVVV